MKPIKISKVVEYVEQNISSFHDKRIQKINSLELKTVLKRKNPYLFKAKHLQTPEQLIRSITDAFISSNEETLFGDWLEELAIFICGEVYGGWKSSARGIDLEFDKDTIRYIVSIKSGPNWGNSSQIKKMISDFNTASRILKTSNSTINVIPVNGCCYGKDKTPLKKDNYYKFCGQDFWAFISGDDNLYTNLIYPLGHKAKERNEEFLKSYAKMITKFVREFAIEYCSEDGDINWVEIVKYNSESENRELN